MNRFKKKQTKVSLFSQFMLCLNAVLFVSILVIVLAALEEKNVASIIAVIFAVTSLFVIPVGIIFIFEYLYQTVKRKKKAKEQLKSAISAPVKVHAQAPVQVPVQVPVQAYVNSQPVRSFNSQFAAEPESNNMISQSKMVESGHNQSNNVLFESILDSTGYEFDEVMPSAMSYICMSRIASVSALQRAFKLTYSRAAQLMDDMEALNLVSEFSGSTPRQVLFNRETAREIINTALELPYVSDYFSQGAEDRTFCPPKEPIIDIDKILKEEKQWRAEQRGLTPVDNELFEIDHMEGHQFENWCAELLTKNGFKSVVVTPGSRDQGVDITATKDGIKYAIQCKCYSTDLGNTPIQEVNAGKAIYHCHVGAVMTNRYFTQSGEEAADATGILLWDRNHIADLLKEAYSNESSKEQG